MHKTLTATALAVVACLPAASASASGTIDWNDRSTVDIELPTRWRIAACQGDAPYLCLRTPDGTPEGSIMLLEYDLPAGADTSRAAVEADAAELYRIFEEDRRRTCGEDYVLEPEPLQELTVGGLPGYRFGFTLLAPDGSATERVVLHLAFDAGRRIVVNTAFSDPQGCPGQDPERDELPMSAVPDVEPHLDRLAAESLLPTDFERFPICRPGAVPSAGFEDTDGNHHRHLIDCLAWFGIVTGYSPSTYGVAGPVTRAQLAAVVARLVDVSGEPLPEPTDQLHRHRR